jgi:hypothetical protein
MAPGVVTSEDHAAAVTADWPEELQRDFWTAVNAPTYDASAAATLALLDTYAHHLAGKIRARSDEARAQEWGRNSGKRAYLTGMEIARKLITPKEK